MTPQHRRILIIILCITLALMIGGIGILSVDVIKEFVFDPSGGLDIVITDKSSAVTGEHHDLSVGTYKVVHTCDLCSEQWLFVLGTGRSGSTTIMSMLNLVPGRCYWYLSSFFCDSCGISVSLYIYRIYNTGIFLSGENSGAVNELLALWKAHLLQERHSYDPPGPWSHPQVNSHGLLCTMQLYVKQILGDYDLSDTKVLGFKEIRHHQKEQLHFFRQLFPCAKYIVNYRHDVAKQAGSGMYQYTSSDGMAKSLQDATYNLLNWTTTMPRSTTYLMPLEQFSVSLFNQMLRWLGVHHCAYVDIHHSNNPAHGTYSQDQRKNILVNTSQCKFVN